MPYSLSPVGRAAAIALPRPAQDGEPRRSGRPDTAGRHPNARERGGAEAAAEAAADATGGLQDGPRGEADAGEGRQGAEGCRPLSVLERPADHRHGRRDQERGSGQARARTATAL
ncbi:hypothetical protein GCM10010425_14200 [Streptomyces spororaveus]|uniref:Uncharacterized protein n=1 Tax=Streptomyces spororaveus TaxID=284039 RepID=A0ABQ3T591_9ACTN|nr:hypothetical protein Sspor_11320 [Streptomyces spororaveus]